MTLCVAANDSQHVNEDYTSVFVFLSMFVTVHGGLSRVLKFVFYFIHMFFFYYYYYPMVIIYFSVDLRSLLTPRLTHKRETSLQCKPEQWIYYSLLLVLNLTIDFTYNHVPYCSCWLSLSLVMHYSQGEGLIMHPLLSWQDYSSRRKLSPLETEKIVDISLCRVISDS